jgi:aryl-alcohol dehydrogenase-like predicted oxidoreductase
MGDRSFALLDAYVQAGGNFLDSAHVYSDWIPGERHRSEKTIGRWLKATGWRDRTIIATKGCHPDLASMSVPRLAPTDLATDLQESLACLGIDQIDLYFLHRDDPRRPVDEIIEALNEHVRAGRIRYFGCSNWSPERIQRAHAYAKAHGLHSFVASQLFWSLAVPNPDAFADDIAVMDDAAYSFYAQAELGVLAFTSQARFFFSRAAAEGVASLKPALRRDFENDTNLGRLERAQRLASELGTTVTAIVLAYLTSQPFTSIPIIGPNTVDQLQESLADSDLVLTPDMLHLLTGGQA